MTTQLKSPMVVPNPLLPSLPVHLATTYDNSDNVVSVAHSDFPTVTAVTNGGALTVSDSTASVGSDVVPVAASITAGTSAAMVSDNSDNTETVCILTAAAFIGVGSPIVSDDSDNTATVGSDVAQRLLPSLLAHPPKLQALVYDILPSTTTVFSYAIGSRKMSANEQFSVGSQTVVRLLQTTQIKQGVSFIASNKVYTSTNKTTIV